MYGEILEYKFCENENTLLMKKEKDEAEMSSF
jgi:hypothetical protein